MVSTFRLKSKLSLRACVPYETWTTVSAHDTEPMLQMTFQILSALSALIQRRL